MAKTQIGGFDLLSMHPNNLIKLTLVVLGGQSRYAGYASMKDWIIWMSLTNSELWKQKLVDYGTKINKIYVSMYLSHRNGENSKYYGER